MVSDNQLFIGLVTFYTILFVLMGVVPSTGVSLEPGTDNPLEDLNPGDDGSWWNDFMDFVNRIFSTLDGLPTVVNALIFSPLVAYAIFWIVKFVMALIPFVG